MAFGALEWAGFGLPLAIGAGILTHYLRGRRTAAAVFSDFEARWKERSTLVVECRVWRSGDKRRAIVALGRDRLALRALGTSEDIEVPLSLLRTGTIRERPDGSRLLDLSLPGERFYLEVAQGFLDELRERLAGRA